MQVAIVSNRDDDVRLARSEIHGKRPRSRRETVPRRSRLPRPVRPEGRTPDRSAALEPPADPAPTARPRRPTVPAESARDRIRQIARSRPKPSRPHRPPSQPAWQTSRSTRRLPTQGLPRFPARFLPHHTVDHSTILMKLNRPKAANYRHVRNPFPSDHAPAASGGRLEVVQSNTTLTSGDVSI